MQGVRTDNFDIPDFMDFMSFLHFLLASGYRTFENLDRGRERLPRNHPVRTRGSEADDASLRAHNTFE
jgi:hypothetical protein